MVLVILFSIILLDQVTKYLAYFYLQPQNTIPIINKFFYLTYLENSGSTFSLMLNRVWVLSGITFLIIPAAVYYFYKNNNMKFITKAALMLIISGILGNIIDKIRLGYVIDFIDFTLWPIFNIADVSLVVGLSIIFIILFFQKQKN